MSSGSIPVVDLALEQINNSTDILRDYSLNYTAILDSKVSYNDNKLYNRIPSRILIWGEKLPEVHRPLLLGSG